MLPENVFLQEARRFEARFARANSANEHVWLFLDNDGDGAGNPAPDLATRKPGDELVEVVANFTHDSGALLVDPVLAHRRLALASAHQRQHVLPRREAGEPLQKRLRKARQHVKGVRSCHVYGWLCQRHDICLALCLTHVKLNVCVVNTRYENRNMKLGADKRLCEDVAP